MSATVEPSLMEELTPSVAKALVDLEPEQQQMFVDEYLRQRRGVVGMVLLAVFFPIQLFFFNKVGLGIAFWLTAGGLYIWYLIEIFLTPRRVRDYNKDVATRVMRDLKIIGS